jgi:hypothetical protein
VTEERVEHIKQKVETVKRQMRELKRIGKRMIQAPDGQISLTDPDARSMATSGMAGYNVQTAMDTKHAFQPTAVRSNQADADLSSSCPPWFAARFSCCR